MRPTRDSIDATAPAPEDTVAKRIRRLALTAAILFFAAPIVYLALAASKAGRALADAEQQTAPAARDAAFYINQGLSLLHLGENDQAIAAWQRALDLDAHNAVAANNIGTAYMLKQQPLTAIPWFEKAIAMDPSLQLAKNNLAWAHNELAKPAQ